MGVCLCENPLCKQTFPTHNQAKNDKSCAVFAPPFFLAVAPFTYLGTQLGEERSTSQVAYRFMWTGRLEVMLTGLEGCMCGEGTPPVRGSPPRSDILEAENGRSDGANGRNTRSSLAPPCVVYVRECVVLFLVPSVLLLPLPCFFRLLVVQMR